MPATANRAIGNKSKFGRGVHDRHAAQHLRICQWLREKRWARHRELAQAVGTGAPGRLSSEVREASLEAGDLPAA